MNKLNNFLDSEKRITAWPSKRENKLMILKYLVTKFEYGVFYTEKEVNQIITDTHTFNDYFILRRELVESKLLNRTRDGSKYWRGDVWSPWEKAETQRLCFKTPATADSAQLKEIYMSVGYLKDWTGSEHKENYIERILVDGDLPPNGHQEFYNIKSIVSKATNEPIAFIEYYNGYPSSKVLWIGLMCIHRNYQRSKYGSEIVEYICDSAKEAGFEKVGIGVHLKNWPAMRFWTKNGFDHITGVHGDMIYSPDTYCYIGLEKNL